MWLNPMLRVETYLTPGPAERQQGGAGNRGFVADADAPVSRRQLDVGLGHRRLGDNRHNAETRRDLPERSGLVRPASIDGDSHAWDGRGGRRRRRPGAAGRWSRWLARGHAPSQGSRVLPARMRFPIRRRYVADRSVREHVTGHRRPLRHPGMIPLSLREIAAAVGRTVDGDSGARRRQASDQPGTPRFHRHSRLYRLPHDRGAGVLARHDANLAFAQRCTASSTTTITGRPPSDETAHPVSTGAPQGRVRTRGLRVACWESADVLPAGIARVTLRKHPTHRRLAGVVPRPVSRPHASTAVFITQSYWSRRPLHLPPLAPRAARQSHPCPSDPRNRRMKKPHCLAGHAACGSGLIQELLAQDDGVRRLRG